MPASKSSYNLIIADKPFPIDWPTYTFQDADPGFNATLTTCTVHSHGQCGPGGAPYAAAKGLSGKTNRFRPRHINERSLAAAQAIIKQFVIHLDGCQDAEMCFNVLHNERGLSCHFILDNDGTLYQTLDLIDCAYHAAGLNETSIGIEICNRGDARPDPNYYSKKPGMTPRDIVTCSINDSKYVAFEFTKKQYEAMEALGKALAKYLPGIKLDYPQTSPGVQNWGTIDRTDLTSVKLRASYAGYIGHYHITDQKWDPGPFDFKKFISKLSGRRSFPVGLHGKAKAEVPDAPPLSERAGRAEYDKLFDAYYDNNEIEGKGGFFPVGPLDNAQLYHGGIHLHPDEGAAVAAPLAGKLILARNGQVTDPEIGSTSFVLLSHSQKVGNVQLNFYSLYMHLAEERKADRPKFMSTKTWADAEPNKVHVMEPPEPVQAGDVIGHVGVGPDGERQLHWEIFTVDPGAVEKLDKIGFWHPFSGAGQERFATDKDLVARLDVKKKDSIITQEELQEVFHAGDAADREWTHHAVTQHYSEWSNEPSWEDAIVNSPENAKKPKRQQQIREMIQNQILPTIWWTDEVAQLIGLPSEARVWTYHPVSFLKWLNDLVGTKQVEVSRKATDADFKNANGKAQLDIDDKLGVNNVNESEFAMDEGHDLQLPDLIDGYGD